MSHSPNRLLGRVAIKIQERLASQKTPSFCIDSIEAKWSSVRHDLKLWQLTRDRSWTTAERHCRLRLERSSQELRQNLDLVLDHRPSRHRLAPAREIYQDLIALEKEFPKVTIDLEQREITVITEPITLEEIELGSFNVVLSWEQLAGGSMPYRVVALEPNRAASSEEISHPHVQDETLCEGEARPMLQLTLEEGHLFDFFLVVVQTLRTYNPSSAFISLAQWFGVPCHDCGSTVDAEERICCEQCEVVICSECYACCASCDRCCCARCYQLCSGCEETVCESCQTECLCCQQPFCERCLGNEKCKTCQAEEEENLPDDDKLEVAVHSHGVGQVSLSA